MKAIDLYKFVVDNEIEYHYTHDNQEVYMWVPYYLIDDFHSVLPKSIFDDDGIQCSMKDDYFLFYMDDICAYSGIELDEIFKK